MAENETPDESTVQPEAEVEIVEIVEVIEVIDEPLADTAAVDAAIARSSEPVGVAEPVTELSEPVEAVAAETVVVEEVAAPSWGAETVAPAPGFAAAAQTVYVQAPIPPKTKGNRWFATLVALIGTVLFSTLYAGIVYIFLSVNAAARHFNEFLMSPIFWGTAIVFFLGYTLLGIIINRGPWWVHAVFSLLVAVGIYFAVVGLTLVAVHAWTLNSAEVAELLRQTWLSPYAIIAAIIAREIPIWFGGWIARNGRKITAKNLAAMEAYEREVAAGPIFQQQ